jgi:protein involved in polysaccharide export with SLBB domain
MFAQQIKEHAITCDISRQLAQLSSTIIRKNPVETLALPVEGLNIPFKDVALLDGDRIEVERLNPEIFTVMGLVNKPGAYPYPPGVKYTLLQALAFGGGLDDIAEPHYVRVYRQTADGSVVDATFSVAGTGLTAAANIPIRPGDVVAVEQTERTRRNQIINGILVNRIGASASVSASHQY